MRYFLPLPVLLFINIAAIGQRNCSFAAYQQASIANNPGLAVKMQDIESFTRGRLQADKKAVTGADQPGKGALPVIMIPVVVHIVYNTPAQDISDAQVRSQIAVLNRDYAKLNPDTSGIPSYYSSLAADCGFQFALANLDTNGNATTGIVRKQTNVQTFDLDDGIKFSAEGGDDGWDRDRYLNIWVGNLTGGTLGYSSVIGGPKPNDGVTVLYTAFGTLGTAAAPFNLGRTTTHEIGHWLNMIHTWGDAFCGNDEVADTPPQQGPTFGDPSGIVTSCSNGPYGNMYMDYMDFTDDIGMHMFTYGQRARMRTLFDPGGFRYAILSSDALSGISLNAATGPLAAPAEAGGSILSVYPNPAVSVVSVVLNDGSGIGSLMDVYNQLGQKIMTARISGLSQTLDVSSLAKGLYIIRLNDGNPHDMAKLVKL